MKIMKRIWKNDVTGQFAEGLQTDPIKKRMCIGAALILSVVALNGCSLDDIKGRLPFLSKNEQGVIEEKTLKEFQELNVDVPLADLTIHSGEEYRIDIERSEGYPVKAKVKNKKLIVRRAEEKSKGSCKLEISIPSGKVLKSGQCRVDVGDVELEGITARQMQVWINVGDCKIQTCDIKKCTVESETGDMLLDKPVAIRKTVLKLAAEAGTITVNGKEHKSPFRNRRHTDRITRLSTALGDIEVRREGYEEEAKASEKNSKAKNKNKKAGNTGKGKNGKNNNKNAKQTKNSKNTKNNKNAKNNINAKNNKNVKNNKNNKSTKKTSKNAKAKKQSKNNNK